MKTTSKKINELDRKAENLIMALHLAKHGRYEDFYKTMCKDFPHWREVEGFDGKEPLEFLFKIVLEMRK